MQAFFRKMAESSTGHQIASVEQIRFITPELATVDGSWTHRRERCRRKGVGPHQR
jgi:hypothetical protein